MFRISYRIEDGVCGNRLACLLACIVNLLMAPVANVLMRLGCQGKGTKNFSRQSDFF